jgi:putative transposase
MLFHALNRGVGRRTLFEKTGDYLALLRVIDETLRLQPMRICGYCLMPNHWHLVLWPQHDGDLSAFLQQMTNTHVKRWQQHRQETGYGHLYQGRFKSFPVQTEEYFYQVMRYVERNALRANLVHNAADWRWSSLRYRTGPERETNGDRPLEMLSQAVLADWPLPRPSDWLARVNKPQTEAELAALRQCVNRGCPYGATEWVTKTADQLGINSSLRQRGRPKKDIAKTS